MPLSTAFFSTSIVQDFQDSPDDEEDTRSSHEYLNDLEEEYQARAQGASPSKSTMVKNKGLIAEAYEWDEKEVSSDDNVMIEVKVLMALPEDNDAVSKEGSRNGEWVKISMRKCDIRKPIWYLDSGCSRHMTGVKIYLHKYVEQPRPKVVFGDDSPCITEGYGSIKCNGIVFTKVALVNGLKYNLISISQLCDAKATGNLNWLWYKRLAHLNFKTINQLAKQNLVIGLPSLVYSKDKPCSSCEKEQGMTHYEPWLTYSVPAFKAHESIFVDFLSKEEPKKVSEALKHLRWVDAMQDELNQFAKNKVWRLVLAPYGKTIISSRWVFRNKRDETGMVEFTFEEIAFTTNNEVALLYPSHPNQEYFKDVSDFISKCCLKEAFTRAPNQYKEYLSEFWYTTKVLPDYKIWVSTPIGEVRGEIGITTFRNSLRGQYLPYSSVCVPSPSITTVRPWFSMIGYNGEIRAKGTLKKSCLPPRWRLLMGQIIQCLGGKIGSLDQISNKDATILYCLANGVQVDYAKIIWEDLIHKLNKKTREKIIPYLRFIYLLLEHMAPKYDNEELIINPTQVFSVHNWILKLNQPKEPPFTNHVKAIYNLDVPVDSKAPKYSSLTEEVPQGSNLSVLVEKTKSVGDGLKTAHTTSGANEESGADDISQKKAIIISDMSEEEENDENDKDTEDTLAPLPSPKSAQIQELMAQVHLLQSQKDRDVAAS
ncbi:retrovirus-related pol polyprotein from transposon TNT 1-94 [Tanacetum coccineum]